MGMIDVERQKRFDYILDHVKNGNFVSKEACNTFYVTKSTITKDLQDLALMYPQLHHNGKHGAGSKWNWIEGVETGDKYSARKTEEGYNDPTAAKAIKNVDGCLDEGPFKPGDVWLVSYVNGSLEKFLVIKGFDKSVSCLKIHTLTDADTYNPVIHAPISMQNKEIVDCRWVLTKPAKYFLEKDKNYNVTNFDAIKRKIGLLLDISLEMPVEKEVIKEVIKEVPGPVEVKEIQVIPDNVEMEMALLKQKAEIYERITWAMLYNVNNTEENV